MRARLPRLTYANVSATLAPFVALGGTGYAATTIGTSQIANNAITTPKIKNAAVTSPKLANNAVSSARIASNAVTGAKIASNAVSSAKIPGNAVSTAKIANAAVTTAKIANGAVTAEQIATGSLNASLFAAGQTPGINPAKITVANSTPVGVAPNNPGATVIATCPAGQKAIAGGFNTGTNAIVDATGPTPDGTGWYLTAETGPLSATITATAVCAAQ
jgi:hypothetical protein